MEKRETFNDRNVLCFYHDDMDGRCSAAIVRRALGESVNLIPMDYGDLIPWDLVEQAQEIIIVDFSFTLQDMERVNSLAELTWVDHHITALTELESLNDVPGIRSVEKAGCVLTWNTFFPDVPVPTAVLYIGDRDIWKHEYPDTRPFGEGLYHEKNDPENDQVWAPLLDEDRDVLQGLIARGNILYTARLMRIERIVSAKGYELEFDGHFTLALNVSGTGDHGEMIRQGGYDIGYCYSESMQNGRLMTFVTLYSSTIDVSEIAKKYGGGGHKGAAGFSFQREGTPFPNGSHIVLR